MVQMISESKRKIAALALAGAMAIGGAAGVATTIASPAQNQSGIVMEAEAATTYSVTNLSTNYVGSAHRFQSKAVKGSNKTYYKIQGAPPYMIKGTVVSFIPSAYTNDDSKKLVSNCTVSSIKITSTKENLGGFITATVDGNKIKVTASKTTRGRAHLKATITYSNGYKATFYEKICVGDVQTSFLNKTLSQSDKTEYKCADEVRIKCDCIDGIKDVTSVYKNWVSYRVVTKDGISMKGADGTAKASFIATKTSGKVKPKMYVIGVGWNTDRYPEITLSK